MLYLCTLLYHKNPHHQLLRLNIPENKERGGHAHKKLEQVLIPISGSFTVVTDDGNGIVFFNFNN